jgi:signal peptidase I
MSDNKDNPFDPPQPERFESPAPPEPAPMQPYLAPSPFEPSPFETAPFEPSPFERSPFEQGPFEPTPFEPPPPRDSRLHYGTAPVAAAAADPLLPPVEPLLPPVEPLLPIDPTVVAVAPEARLALDGTSLWLNRLGEELVAWLKTLASAAVYATLIVTFGFQVARVEGMSMAPTLQDQDRLIVNKLAYRLGDPQVGDIVMLYYPLKPDKSFVKRIIAEEGDQLRIVDGRVFRNDVPLDDSFVPPEYRSHDDWGPEVVPEGYYFVMGDHRNNSSDSRHWRYVPKKYIIGKVQLRWWPMGHAKVF